MVEKVTIQGAELHLLPEKVIYWPQKNILFMADLHLGKVNHFRRSGIALPGTPNVRNLEMLIGLLHRLQPKRLIFLGDLFHSDYNHEWEVFGQTISYFPDISFELVQGNHDVMTGYQYEKHRLIMHGDRLDLDPFSLTHAPDESPQSDYYNLAGHIHPGVRLRGKGRQGLTLPCFYFNGHQGLLPAFGAFTGLYRLHPKMNDKIYVITPDRVMRIN